MQKQVLIVEDHEQLAMALAQGFNSDPSFRTCGVVGDLGEAVALMPTVRVDLVMMDIDLPSGSGLDLIAVLQEMKPSARFLVYSAHEANPFSVRAREAGAHGYLQKGVPLAVVLDAASIVVGGGRYFPSLD